MTGKLKIVAAALLTVGLILIIIGLLSRPDARPLPVVGSAPVEDPGFNVVVAKATLPFGEPIPNEALEIRNVKQKQSNSFSEISELAGRIPVLTVPQGQVLTRAAFETNPLVDQVRPGFRAVAIRVDEQTAGVGRLRPGDLVDVFTVFKRDDRDITATQSRQVLSRLRIISVGQKIVGQAENREVDAAVGTPGSGNTGGAQPPVNIRNVTVEVPVNDVNLLLLAQQQGALMLTLRNPDDSGLADRAAFPEPVALLTKKENKDNKGSKAPPQELSAEDKAYAGLAINSLVGTSPVPSTRTPPATTTQVAARPDTSGKTRKDMRDEPPRTEMIRRGKTTNEAAQ